MKRILIVLIALMVSGCAMGTKPSIVNLSERIDDVAGVSVLPPQEEGWKVFKKDKTQLVLGKNGPTEDSSYIAAIKIFRLPELETEQQFTQYISKGKKAQAPEERFNVIQNKEETINGGTNYIMKYHNISEDKVATEKLGNNTMILEIMGYTFQHPKNHSIGIELGYSYRYHLGSEDIKFEEKANAFLDGITITDL